MSTFLLLLSPLHEMDPSESFKILTIMKVYKIIKVVVHCICLHKGRDKGLSHCLLSSHAPPQGTFASCSFPAPVFTDIDFDYICY